MKLVYFLYDHLGKKRPSRDAYIPRRCPISGSEELSAYADGMLDGAVLRRIDAHIAGCDECGAMLRELNRLRETLQSVRDTPTPAGKAYWSKTFRAARQDVTLSHPSRAPRAHLLRRVVPRVWAFAAVGAAACFATAMFIFAMPSVTRNATFPFLHNGSSSSVQLAAMRRASIREHSAGELGINALVESHARMVSEQPLEDHARATYVVSDLTARSSGESAPAPALQEMTLGNGSEMDSRSVVTSN